MAYYSGHGTPSWTPRVDQGPSTTAQLFNIGSTLANTAGNVILGRQKKAESAATDIINHRYSDIKDLGETIDSVYESNPSNEEVQMLKREVDTLKREIVKASEEPDYHKRIKHLNENFSEKITNLQHRVTPHLEQYLQQNVDKQKGIQNQTLYNAQRQVLGEPDKGQREASATILRGGASPAEIPQMLRSPTVNPMMPGTPLDVNQALGPQTDQTRLARARDTLVNVPKSGGQANAQTFNAQLPGDLALNMEQGKVPRNTKEAVMNVVDTIKTKVTSALTGKDVSDFLSLSKDEQNMQLDKVIQEEGIDISKLSTSEKNRLRLRVKSEILKLRSKKSGGALTAPKANKETDSIKDKVRQRLGK